MGTHDEHTLAELEAESRRIQDLAAKLMAEIERILREIEHRDDKPTPPQEFPRISDGSTSEME